MTATLERPALESPSGMLRGAAKGGIANLAGTVCVRDPISASSCAGDFAAVNEAR